jgi:hypothetical protein
LTDVKSFADTYRALAEEANIAFTVESEWNVKYRITQDVVILGSKYLAELNHAYYTNAVIILKKDESPAPYIAQGINHFIFDYTNVNELVFAFYRQEKVIVHSSSVDLGLLIKDCNVFNFQFGEYDFKFDRNKFMYKNKPIYFNDSAKRYLIEWLLNGHKDNKKRMILCNLRKKFGDEFLRDVDRFGQFKEEKNE